MNGGLARLAVKPFLGRGVIDIRVEGTGELLRPFSDESENPSSVSDCRLMRTRRRVPMSATGGGHVSLHELTVAAQPRCGANCSPSPWTVRCHLHGRRIDTFGVFGLGGGRHIIRKRWFCDSDVIARSESQQS